MVSRFAFRSIFTRAGLRRGALVLAGVAALFGLAAPVAAQGRLPEPYVSPALDAVLMPITPAVKQQFKLPRAATGVVVASVQPGGVGELYGFEPGEVISSVDTKLIRRPVDLDSIVGYGVDNGESLFVFDGLWKGRKQRTIAQIDGDGFRAPVSFERADRWPGYRGRGFDYARWYTPYAPRVRSVWDDTFTYIAAVIITDVFLDALRSDQAVFYFVDDRYYWPQDEYYITDVDQVFYSTYSEEVYSVTYTEEVRQTYYEETYTETYTEESYYEETATYSEESTTEETVTEDAYGDIEDTSFVDTESGEGAVDDGSGDDASAAYDDQSGQDGVDDGSGEGTDAAYDDQSADSADYADPAAEEGAYDDTGAAEDGSYDEPVAEDGSYEEPVADESTYDEPVAEDQAYEEPAYEEPAYEEPVAEEQAYEEPAYEEPAYEEPAYEEPAYEEPAYDGGDGGGEECPVDEDGNLMCQ